MKLKIWFLFIFITFTATGFAQNNLIYKAEKEKTHTLIHTKLKVDFNFEEKQLNGEAWVTAKPHFYASNTFILDAKSMLIHEISLK
jgi:aminopeptidase N